MNSNVPLMKKSLVDSPERNGPDATPPVEALNAPGVVPARAPNAIRDVQVPVPHAEPDALPKPRAHCGIPNLNSIALEKVNASPAHFHAGFPPVGPGLQQRAHALPEKRFGARLNLDSIAAFQTLNCALEPLAGSAHSRATPGPSPVCRKNGLQADLPGRFGQVERCGSARFSANNFGDVRDR